MRHYVFAVTIAAMGALAVTPAMAHDDGPSWNRFSNSHRAEGKVLSSYAVYGSEGQPTTRRVCHDVKIPIYRGASDEDRLGNTVAGAVIGGILGKAVTGDNGGATVGAVVGGVVGSNKNKRHVAGYRTEERCKTETFQPDRVVLYYKTAVRLDGDVYLIKSSNKLQSGASVEMYLPD